MPTMQSIHSLILKGRITANASSIHTINVMGREKQKRSNTQSQPDIENGTFGIGLI